MITRARRGLIVIGNTDTLRSDPTWGSWLDWADEQGLIITSSERPRPEATRRQPARQEKGAWLEDRTAELEEAAAMAQAKALGAQAQAAATQAQSGNPQATGGDHSEAR